MESPSNMTRDQKERYVVELLKQNKGTRYIAQRAHKSFRDIGLIRRKMEKKAELEKRRLEGKGGNNSKSKSKSTQAIKMFSEGRNLTEIVIELDLPPEKARRILREYLEAGNMYEVLQIYDDIKASHRQSFPSFVRLYRVLSDLGMGEQQIKNVLELAKRHQLERLLWKVEQLRNDVNMLEAAKTKSTNDILRLTKVKDELIADVSFLKNGKVDSMNDSDIEVFYTEDVWQYPGS